MFTEVKYILILVAKLMSGRLLKNFMLLLFFAATGIMIGISLVLFNVNRYDEKTINNMCDSSQTGYIFIDENEGYESELKLYQELAKCEEVDSVAEVINLGADLGVINELQAGHQYTPEYEATSCTEVTTVDRAIFDIFSMKIDWKEDNKQSKDGVILGDGYRKDIGEDTTIRVGDQKIPILGYIHAGEKWISGDVQYPNGQCEITSLVDTSYMVFTLKQDDTLYSCSFYYTIKDGVSKKEFKDKAKELAKQNNCTISVSFMDEYIKNQTKSNDTILQHLLKYCMYMTVCLFILICILQMFHILIHNREYGVLYASGLTGKQVIATAWVENALMIGLSFALAMVMLANGMRLAYSAGYSLRAEVITGLINKIIYTRVIFQEGILFIIIYMIVSILPTILLKKMNVVTMMKGLF